MGKGLENPFHDILAESFPNLEKHVEIQIPEIQRTSDKFNTSYKN